MCSPCLVIIFSFFKYIKCWNWRKLIIVFRERAKSWWQKPDLVDNSKWYKKMRQHDYDIEIISKCSSESNKYFCFELIFNPRMMVIFIFRLVLKLDYKHTQSSRCSGTNIDRTWLFIATTKDKGIILTL